MGHARLTLATEVKGKTGCAALDVPVAGNALGETPAPFPTPGEERAAAAPAAAAPAAAAAAPEEPRPLRPPPRSVISSTDKLCVVTSFRAFGCRVGLEVISAGGAEKLVLTELSGTQR